MWSPRSPGQDRWDGGTWEEAEELRAGAMDSNVVSFTDKHSRYDVYNVWPVVSSLSVRTVPVMYLYGSQYLLLSKKGVLNSDVGI
jgi:hypothetical protein